MPDFEKVLNALFTTLKLVFGENIPPKIKVWLGYIILSVFSLLLLWLVLFILSKLIDLFRDKFLPLFYNSEARRRSERRRRFAEHLESEIRQLNLREAWQDYRFTELEAEVEAEGRRRKKTWIPFLSLTQSGLRREKSLSRALEASEERLILLEGDPGSGKSVALRHVAQKMAARAMRSRNTNSIIPIYVNLKAMERRRNEKVDRNLIHNFVVQSLNRANDRDIEEFLEQEFLRGLEEGTWFFLFDSFDELPEVLSSAEADETVRSYGQAIESFLREMNKCRGVIASREFRGPNQLGWPVFNIFPLTEKRREVLIKKSNLDSRLESKIIGHLNVAEHEMRVWASNPMFLNLLCEHLKGGKPFPEHTHDILETYLKERLERDEEKLKRKFNLKVRDVSSAAEKIAFCMTAETNIGLNPTRKDILAATEKLQLSLGRNFEALLDALEYLKLARSENNPPIDKTKSFTFSHRRFQEYFATCVVLRDPSRVTVLQLLTDARWRETAVVLCQTQLPDIWLPVVAEAHALMVKMNSEIPGLIQDPDNYTSEKLNDEESAAFKNDGTQLFKYPENAVPLLDLLQDAFRRNVEDLPHEVREEAGKIVFTATMKGMLVDRKTALEVAGIAPQSWLERMLRLAFVDRSQWLKDTAYQQVAKLRNVSKDIASGIRKALVLLMAKDNPHRELLIARVHVARLNNPTEFLYSNRILRATISNYYLLGHCLLLVLLLKIVVTVMAKESFLWDSAIGWPFIIMIITTLGLFPYFTRLALRAADVFDAISSFTMPLMITTLVYVLVLQWADLSILEYCIMGAFVYVSIWPLAARSITLQGKYLHLLIWPVYPLTIGAQLPYKIIKNLKTGGRKVSEWFHENWRKLIAISIFPITVTFGAMLLFVLSWWLHGKGDAGKLASRLLMVLIVVSMFVTMIWMEVRSGNLRRLDKREWKRQQSIIVEVISGEKFAHFLYSYKTLPYQVQFVNFVRTKDLLAPNKVAEDVLTKVAIFAEESVRDAENYRVDLSGHLLDEVSMLLERVRQLRTDK